MHDQGKSYSNGTMLLDYSGILDGKYYQQDYLYIYLMRFFLRYSNCIFLEEETKCSSIFLNNIA